MVYMVKFIVIISVLSSLLLLYISKGKVQRNSIEEEMYVSIFVS